LFFDLDVISVETGKQVEGSLVVLASAGVAAGHRVEHLGAPRASRIPFAHDR